MRMSLSARLAVGCLLHDSIGHHLDEYLLAGESRDDHPLAGRDHLHWRELAGYALIRNGTSRLLVGSPAAELLEHSSLFISNMISLTAMLEAGIGMLCRANVSLSPAAAAMRQHVMDHLREREEW